MLLPALLPVAGLVLVLVADLVVPRLRRVPYAVAGLASLGSALAAVPGLGLGGGSARETFCLAAGACLWRADALTSTLQLAAALCAAVCIALAWPAGRTAHSTGGGTAHSTGGGTGHSTAEEATSEPVEAVLLLAALTGAVVVAASRDVGTWLVALELATLPVIVLVALSGRGSGRRAAVAGATQLLVTSIVSFALLVLGVALWFAATGSPFLTADAVLGSETSAAIATASSSSGGQGWFAYAPLGGVEGASGLTGPVLALAVVLMLVGLGFKLSLVPFHAWTPTAYSGASPPVAAFLATVSKIAALSALLVVLRAVASLGGPGLLTIGVLAAVSMTVGNVLALRQDDVVRLLAWSTVAQAGWVVLPLVSVSALGIGASGTYLLTYVIATLVAFAVVAVTVREQPDGRRLAAYDGLWHRSPWRAGALVLALTSLAGLPPGVIGLVGKIAALRPVVAEGWLWLALIAAVNAVLGVAVYLRWLRGVITAPDVAPATPRAAEEVAAATDVTRRRIAAFGLVVAAAVLVAVSVQPDLLLRLLG
ncbi:MAG: NADH-quinone oxidoreductase subunit N [Humibacillus sp.]